MVVVDGLGIKVSVQASSVGFGSSKFPATTNPFETAPKAGSGAIHDDLVRETDDLVKELSNA